MFVAATVAASLTFAFIAAPTTHAADVTWNGDSIMYDGNLYQKGADATANDGLGLPEGSHVYRYITPKDDSLGANAPPQKAYVIYFAPGKDPTKEKNAQFAVYDFTPPATFTNKTGQKNVSVEERQDDNKGSSCKIDGIGWLVCSVSEFLASSVDWLFSHVLAQFLTVRPVQSNTDNQLYKAWSIMRSIANIAFAGAFLIIIYSQVTSIGLSNYGIKKLLPRLVVAAVLVNISYWICAIAIDLSNITGYALNDLLQSITDSVRGAGTQTDLLNFESVTGAVLSGGTLAAAGVLSVIAKGGIVGAISFLLPALVLVLIAAVVAIIIMAARQALILILVIVAPLAFVAYLLPNTEKYFEKWKDLLMTMLLLFPIFSVIFGGSQLAGTAIIQNADSIIMLILGMTVQVVPLVIMPFMIKFSGSLLGRIAGITNDRTKGLLDETRNYAQSIADSRKAKALGAAGVSWKRSPITRAIQAKDNGRRKREGMQKANEALADARWEGHKNAAKVHDATARAALLKEDAEARSERHVEATKLTDESMQALDIHARASKLDVDFTKAQVDANWTDLKAGDASNLIPANQLALSALTRQVATVSRDEAVVGLRKQSAERKSAIDLTNDLIASSDPDKLRARGDELRVDGKALSEYSGGALGPTGAETVLAGAVDKYRSELRARIGEKKQLLKHFNVTQDDIFKLAMGESIQPYEKDGIKYTFTQDDYMQEAAGDHITMTGAASQIQTMYAESGINPLTGEKGKTWNIRTSLADAVKEKGLDKKAIFYGHNTIDDIAQGKIYGEPGLNMAAARSLANGKATDEAVSSMSSIALERMFKITAREVELSAEYQAKDAAGRAKMVRDFQENQQELRYSAYRVMHDNLLMRHADVNTRKVLQDNAASPPSTP